MKVRKLRWEYWVCPLGTNLDDVELPDMSSVTFDKPSMESENEYDLGLEFQDEVEAEQQIIEAQPANYPVPLYISSMGIIPMTEHTKPSKRFRFWALSGCLFYRV